MYTCIYTNETSLKELKSSIKLKFFNHPLVFFQFRTVSEWEIKFSMSQCYSATWRKKTVALETCEKISHQPPGLEIRINSLNPNRLLLN